MAGISVKTCISLILQHIGGIPLQGATKSLVEGVPPAKQIGIGSFSLPSLEMLSSALDGASMGSMLGDVFQNPIGSVTENLGSSITSVTSNLESTFVESTVGADNALIRTVKSQFASKISLQQIDSLKSTLGNLNSSIPSLTDLTNKISGVTMPSFEIEGDFGLPQVTSITSSFESLAEKIPDSLNEQVGGLRESLGGHLDSITAPLNLGNTLSSTNDIINGLVSSLTNASNAGSAASIINSATSTITATRNTVDDSVDTSKSTMSSLINGAQAIAYVDSVSSAIDSGSTKNQQFLSKVVKPSAMTQIKEGIEAQKNYYNGEN